MGNSGTKIVARPAPPFIGNDEDAMVKYLSTQVEWADIEGPNMVTYDVQAWRARAEKDRSACSGPLTGSKDMPAPIMDIGSYFYAHSMWSTFRRGSFDQNHAWLGKLEVALNLIRCTGDFATEPGLNAAVCEEALVECVLHPFKLGIMFGTCKDLDRKFAKRTPTADELESEYRILRTKIEELQFLLFELTDGEFYKLVRDPARGRLRSAMRAAARVWVERQQRELLLPDHLRKRVIFLAADIMRIEGVPAFGAHANKQEITRKIANAMRERMLG
ncbi:unnamed protein product [Amoebophrya sp. A25]|nr:unnamed protein product [Amoebophrya sp. A25]|eukprot:GSA25T00011528001.1